MDSIPPPPLVGFNNNVRYRGMRFHIQTEDSGVTRPHIITHLFADGGYVIKSVRTDYSEYVNRPDRPEFISKMMRDQHRAMALDLRDGRLDAKIDDLTRAAEADGPPTVAEPPLSEQQSERPSDRARARKGQKGRGKNSSPPPSRKDADAKDSKKRSRNAPGARRSQPPARKTLGRPVLGGKPNAASIFGAAPQESLDDVILGYVTTTKNGPSTRRSK